MKTVDFIKRWPMSEELREELLGAIAKSGRNEGYLLKDAPGSNVAWQVLVSSLNANRINVTSLMMSGSGAQFNELDDRVKKELAGLNLTAILTALEPYARWNLPPSSFNADNIKAQLEQLLAQFEAKRSTLQ